MQNRIGKIVWTRLIPDFGSSTKCILPCKSVGSSCARQITCNQPLWWWRRNQFVVLAQRSRWVLCTVVPNAIGFWVCKHPIQSSSSSWSSSWNVWQIQNSSAMEWTANENKTQWQVARTLQRWSVGVLYHFYVEKKTGRVEHQEKNALHSYILEKLKDNCDLKIGRNSNNRGKDENNHSHITKSNRAGRGCNPSTYQHLRPYQWSRMTRPSFLHKLICSCIICNQGRIQSKIAVS